MAHPRRVVVIKRPLPARVPEGAVYVGRRSWGLPGYPFGTPCLVQGVGRAEAVELYRTKCLAEPEFLRAAAEFIGDQNAACWCPLDEPCHADVLLELINALVEGYDLEDGPA